MGKRTNLMQKTGRIAENEATPQSTIHVPCRRSRKRYNLLMFWGRQEVCRFCGPCGCIGRRPMQHRFAWRLHYKAAYLAGQRLSYPTRICTRDLSPSTEDHICNRLRQASPSLAVWSLDGCDLALVQAAQILHTLEA